MTSLMTRRVLMRAAAVAICGSLMAASVSLAGSKTKRPIKKLTYDPDAPKVELFEGIDGEVITVKMIPKDSKSGRLLVENKTDKPLTVEMPEGFVGVQVVAQDPFGGGGGGQQGGQGGGQGGGQQAVGGGGGGGGQGGGIGGGGGGGSLGGGGFFSIPAEKVVMVPYKSICLEHGKAEPSPRGTFRITRVEDFSDDERLHELIRLVGTRRIPVQAAQAAAWHLSSEMSWLELVNEKHDRVGRADTPYFSRLDLMQAQQLVSYAATRAEDRKKDQQDAAEPTIKPRTAR